MAVWLTRRQLLRGMLGGVSSIALASLAAACGQAGSAATQTVAPSPTRPAANTPPLSPTAQRPTPGLAATPTAAGPTGSVSLREYPANAAQLAAAKYPLIVRGSVREIRPGEWFPTTGKRPTTTQTEAGGAIMTPILIAAREYLKGPQPQQTVLLYVAGGTFGQVVAEIHPSVLPALAVGNELIAICQGPLAEFTMPATRDGYPVWAAMLTYTVDSAGRASLGEGSMPLQTLLDQIERGEGGQ